VGEGDGVLARLDEHIKTKSFWTHAIVFISKDQNLNKAHVKHLESRLITLASQAKLCELINGNTPQQPTLSEADAADTESFLSDLLLCLPVVGIHFFEKIKATRTTKDDLILKSTKIKARCVESAEGFIVREGSQASKTETPSVHPSIIKRRQALIENGVLADGGDIYVFTQDYPFTSPSTAADVLLGRSANGRTEWRDSKGRTLKEIQEQGG
jgi:hypothetical protein